MPKGVMLRPRPRTPFRTTPVVESDTTQMEEE
jgi:hypothetical protein